MSAGALYRTARWERCRQRQLAREAMCEACEVQPATTVDHIKPVSQGGAMWSAENWQSMCASCHSEKTACDKTGRKFVPYKYSGCFDDGSPRDPSHPWFTGGGPAITAFAAPRTDGGHQNPVSFSPPPKRR